MAALTIQEITRDGLTISWEDADPVLGDTFENDGDIFTVISNTSESPWEITFATPKLLNGLEIEERLVTVLASTDTVLGPFPINVYSDPTGIVHITYESGAILRIAAIRRPH